MKYFVSALGLMIENLLVSLLGKKQKVPPTAKALVKLLVLVLDLAMEKLWVSLLV